MHKRGKRNRGSGLLVAQLKESTRVYASVVAQSKARYDQVTHVVSGRTWVTEPGLNLDGKHEEWIYDNSAEPLPSLESNALLIAIARKD